MTISIEDEQRLLELANIIYQAENQEDIHRATHEFTTFVIERYPRSLPTLEELITRKEVVSFNTRKALVSLYRTCSEQLKSRLQN